ncbi:MAG: acyl-CoA desaturase [Schleiferiaceae bacterium]|nr:acyl-CoA desaturase [Schleiferiaceae bacterium]
MRVSTVKFNHNDQPEFFLELRKRVNNYFKENNISKFANTSMKVKTAFMLTLYFLPLTLMLTGVVASFWGVFTMWIFMGLGMSGLGLSVMHDANHGSYSSNPRVNRILGGIISLLGGYSYNWKIQHNVLHHSFTNVEGHDEDFETALMRLSPNQERKKGFRYQGFYAPFVYSLMTIYWLTGKDYTQVMRYKKKNLLASQGLTFKRALWDVSINKVWYFSLLLALPMVLVSLPWWQILIGFISMHLVSGLILALIFQSAHVINETEFTTPDENGSVENSWAIQQLRSTANFANGSAWFSWLIGGLNFQVEHHLFPNICHVHYKKVSEIVKKTAKEYNLPYYEHKTFASAVKSHFSLIHALGTGEYDLRMAKKLKAA